MKTAFGIATVLIVAVCSNGLSAKEQEKVGQHPETFTKDGASLQYELYLPPKYNADPSAKWPLIIFLHGSGERGSNVANVKKHGPPKIVEDKDSPLAGRFIVASPQCPEKAFWNPAQLNGLLDDLIQRYHVDTDRVYLTGLSMGGFGTWMWASHNPERFAAIAPLCGGGDPTKADQLKKMPIWVFHGEKDTSVNISRSEAMVEAVKKAGNEEVKFTRYPDAGHDCWTRSYANPELYEWFLKHKK